MDDFLDEPWQLYIDVLPILRLQSRKQMFGSLAQDGLLADGEPYNAKVQLQLWVCCEGLDRRRGLTVPQTHAWGAGNLIVLCCVALCPNLQGGWTPTHTVTLEPGILGNWVGKCQVVAAKSFGGEALLIPPAFVHESWGPQLRFLLHAMKDPFRLNMLTRTLKGLLKYCNVILQHGNTRCPWGKNVGCGPEGHLVV